MLRELVNKLRTRKERLLEVQSAISTPAIEQNDNVEIVVSRQDDFYKIVISDYISSRGLVDRISKDDSLNVLNSFSNSIFWSNSQQKFSSGTYYVISLGNKLYNFRFNGS